MPGIADQVRELVKSATNHARRIRRLEILESPKSIVRPKGGHIIQDEGSDLPDQVYLDFIGKGVTAEDDPGGGKTTVTIPGAIQEALGVPLDRIILIHADGFGVDIYNPISEGFDYALVGASSGDVIYVPPATIDGNHTIKAGVEIWGAGRDKTIFSGIITLTADSVLNNLSVLTSQNDNNLLNAVIGTSAGTASIHNCTIIATQLDDGQVRAVHQPSGGELFIWYSDIQANGAGHLVVTTGDIGWLGMRCYGIYVSSGGSVTHRWCRVSSESQGIDSNPFYDTGATFAVNASLDTGAFDVVAEAGVVIGGLTVGQWYCIENTGGPFDNGDLADNLRYGWLISSDNGTTWHIVEEMIAGGARAIDIPPYCEKSEGVGANHARTYFYAQGTSVKVRVYDVEGDFADNLDSMGWELSSATVSFEATESFSIDISNQVGAIITAQRLGERSAYDIDDHAEEHASDIYTNIMLRHLPAPGTSGNIPYDDGDEWKSGTPAEAGIVSIDSISVSENEENTLTVGLDSIRQLENISLIGLVDADTSNPVLDIGGGGASDFRIREIGNILYEPLETERKYKIFYTGYNAGAAIDEKIHYAYSEDGINWTKSASNPVINGRRAEDPYVLKKDNIYYLFAEDKQAGGDDSIRLWSSSDCETWADLGQITGISDSQSPVVWIEGEVWYMLYEHFPVAPNDIRLATSSDGLAWINEVTNPVFSAGDTSWAVTTVVPNDIRRVGETYYLTYHGWDGALFQMGIAKSTNLTNWTDNGDYIETDDVADNILHSQFLYDNKWSFYYYTVDTGGIYRGYPMDPTLTILVGTITPHGDYYLVAAESGIADDLDTIDANKTFQFLVLQADAGDTITLRDGVDNIHLNGGADFELTGDKTIVLFYDGTNWSDLGVGGAGGGCPEPTCPYWEPAIIAAGFDIFYMADGDIAMVWVT